MGAGDSAAMSMIHESVSVSNNFIHFSTAADQGYHTFGDLARLVCCLLQKNKKASSLPPVEQWEEYIVPNHSRFPAIDEKDFLFGTPLMAALDKVGSQYLWTQFRRDNRCFLEEFVNSFLSTVASRSVIGQGLSCFCPAFLVSGDDVAPFQRFNKLLDGLLEKGWTRGSEFEASRAEYLSLMQQKRQLERSSTRSRPDVGDILSFISAHARFLARGHLYIIRIVSNQACCSDFHELFCFPHKILLFQVFQLTTLVIRGPATRGDKFVISLERIAIKKEEVHGVLLCEQDFFRGAHFTLRSFFSQSGFTILSESVAMADSTTSSPFYAPCSVVESACASQVITDLCACWDRVVLRRHTARDTIERWYHGGTPRSETASRPGVRISDIVGEGRFEYVAVAAPALGPPRPSKIRSSPSKLKRKISRSPVKLPRRFEVSSPPASPRGDL